MNAHSPSSRQSEWRAFASGLWSICWRLWLLLPFFVGAIIFGFLDHWCLTLACVVGFVTVVCVKRYFWPASDPDEPEDRPCDYYV